MILQLISAIAAEDWQYQRTFERYKRRYNKKYATILEE